MSRIWKWCPIYAQWSSLHCISATPTICSFELYNKQHVESKKSYFNTPPPKTNKYNPNSDHGNPWHSNPSGKLFPNHPRGGVTIHELQVRRPVRDSNIACARWVEAARAPWVMQFSNEAVSPEWNVPLKDVKWAAGWHGVDDTWPSKNM